MTKFEAAVALVVSGVSLAIALGIGVRWMLQTWNREDDGSNLGP